MENILFINLFRIKRKIYTIAYVYMSATTISDAFCSPLQSENKWFAK